MTDTRSDWEKFVDITFHYHCKHNSRKYCFSEGRMMNKLDDHLDQHGDLRIEDLGGSRIDFEHNGCIYIHPRDPSDPADRSQCLNLSDEQIRLIQFWCERQLEK